LLLLLVVLLLHLRRCSNHGGLGLSLSKEMLELVRLPSICLRHCRRRRLMLVDNIRRAVRRPA
jgi:hypothetical protein